MGLGIPPLNSTAPWVWFWFGFSCAQCSLLLWLWVGPLVVWTLIQRSAFSSLFTEPIISAPGKTNHMNTWHLARQPLLNTSTCTESTSRRELPTQIYLHVLTHDEARIMYLKNSVVLSAHATYRCAMVYVTSSATARDKVMCSHARLLIGCFF